MKNLLFSLVAIFCACSSAPKASQQPIPISDGNPVPGFPEPEVVQLQKIETVGPMKHITVSNAAGEYVLVCNEETNDTDKYGIPSCLSPQPQRNYLLFKAATKWHIKDAKGLLDLKFMQDFSVSYPGVENIGLMPARKLDDEHFGVYQLLSWRAKNP